MFTFEMHLNEQPVLALFCGRNLGSDFDYGSSLEISLKKYQGSYSAIIFLVPNYLRNYIRELIAENNRLVSNITRYGDHCCVMFYCFDEYGALECFDSITASSLPETNLDWLQKSIVECGISDLMSRRAQSVILAAPPGTTFKKPSSDEYVEFIKSSELAIGCAETQFIAFCLLAQRPKSVVKSIYIDSASISSYVVALISYIREFSNTALLPLNYKSFNSYAGMKECEPDFKDDIWVIISASASNNMGRRILNEWKGLTHDQIVTILSFKSTKLDDDGAEKGDGDKIVANILRYSMQKKNSVKANKLIPLQVIGENFTAQIDPPQQVILRKPHLPNSAREFLIETAELNLFSMNKFDGRKLRNICFNSLTFLKSDLAEAFYNWLKLTLIWNVPFGIKYVIFDKSDVASVEIFRFLFSILPKEIKGIDTNEIDKHDFGDCSVVVFAPVISSGRIFLKANRDLRMRSHSGPRIFFTICSLFKSQKNSEIFEKSLLQGPGSLKYKFFSFRSLILGDTENSKHWENEKAICEALSDPVFKSRAALLQKESEGISNSIGMPSHISVPTLSFNKHFAFWSVDYEPSKISHGAVYVTLAAVLQNLRDKPSCDEDSLYFHVYKHAVLDPDNFSRFNEGVIQASLWRVAEDIEVNYKNLIDASSNFFAILTNLCKEDSNTNALSDLLLGIACGKIQLHAGAIDAITSQLPSMIKNIPPAIELIEYIDKVIRRGETWGDSETMF